MTEKQLLRANEISSDIKELKDEINHFKTLIEIIDSKKTDDIAPFEMTAESFESPFSYTIYFDQGILKNALVQNLTMTKNKIEALELEFNEL